MKINVAVNVLGNSFTHKMFDISQRRGHTFSSRRTMSQAFHFGVIELERFTDFFNVQ